MVTQTNSALINQELLELIQECHVQKWEIGSPAAGGGVLQRFKHTNNPGRAIQTQLKQMFIFRHLVYSISTKP